MSYVSDTGRVVCGLHLGHSGNKRIKPRGTSFLEYLLWPIFRGGRIASLSGHIYYDINDLSIAAL